MKAWVSLMILISFGLGILVGAKAVRARAEGQVRGVLAQTLAREAVPPRADAPTDPGADPTQALGERVEDLRRRQAVQQERLAKLNKDWEEADPEKIWGSWESSALSEVDSLSAALDLDAGKHELLKQVHEEIDRRLKASEVDRAQISVKRGRVSIVIRPVDGDSLARELKELWTSRALPLLDARQRELYGQLDLGNYLPLDSLRCTTAILLEPRGDFVMVSERSGYMQLDENGNAASHSASWSTPNVYPKAKTAEKYRHLLEKGGLYPLPKDLSSK
jgi:hypothetical protein